MFYEGCHPDCIEMIQHDQCRKKDGSYVTNFPAATARVRLKTLTPPEAVDHPAHYGGKDNPYEAIKVIEAWGLDFCLGNTVKYISRAGKKGSEVEDLEKAVWYLNRRIMQLKVVATIQSMPEYIDNKERK